MRIAEAGGGEGTGETAAGAWTSRFSATSSLLRATCKMHLISTLFMLYFIRITVSPDEIVALL